MIGSNEATLFAAVAFYRDDTLSGNNTEWGLQFLDGATAQCTVVFESGGNITLRSGGISGSVLATYPTAYTSQTWAHFQIKVVINNTTGSIAIRKDGATSDSFAATGLNTRGGTANNYASKVAVASYITGNTTYYFDDLLLYSGSGAAPNDWVGDIRAVALMPNADTAQKQFTAGPTAQTFGNAATTNTKSGSANTITMITASPPASDTVAKMTVNFNASFSGHAKCAIYAADGGSGTPGTLLATSAEVTNPGAGNVDFTFASPPAVIAGTSYILAILADAAFVTKAQGSIDDDLHAGADLRQRLPGFDYRTGSLS